MPIFEKYSLNLLFVIVSGFLAACSSGSLKENPKQFPSPDPRVDVEKERRDNLPRQMETGVDSAFTSRFDGSTDSADRSRYLPFTSAQGGMVVSDDGEASECGAEILRKGGNAVDAAVATAFALSVSRPHFASIGGGGFLLFCPAPKAGDGQSDFVSGKKCQAMDYRETAPKGSFRDMYVQNGKGNTELSQAGALASAVPGTVAGLLQALKEWGRLPREKVMACAIRMARTGVRVSSNTEAGAVYRWKKMNAEAKRIFGDSTDTPLKPGAILVQYDLARVLESISRQGEKGFYKGWVARRLAKGLKDAGGIITQEDLESYHPVIRTPVEGSYRGQTVVSMPPPSSGGFLVIQMLQFAKLAEATQSFTEGPGSIHTLHAEAFSMDLAFADRAQYMGDPDFFKVPLAELLDSHYLASRWSIFNPEKVSEVSPGQMKQARANAENGEIHEGKNTTHFSVVDAEGSAVSLTTTINEYFGSAFVPPGTGVVMNNEMDDFSIQPGVPNLFGLVGGEANSIQPGKRPLSSMSPTITLDSTGRPRLVLGASGGPRIATAVYLTLMNRLRFDLSLPDSVIASRIHHQWKPAHLKYEVGGFPFEVREGLVHLGYQLDEIKTSADIKAIESFPSGRTWGVADPRGEGRPARP